MFSSSRLIRIVVLAVLTIGVASLASAQAPVNSGAQAITLNATLAESLTVSLSANAVNFTLAAGSATNAGSTGVTATTTWVLRPGRTTMNLDAYFGSAAAALTDGAGNNIPSSVFQINNNGTGAAALTNTVAFGAANAGLRLRSESITGTNKNFSVTDAMTFNIDLSSLAMQQLPAATYTGTLNIQAQAVN